MKTILCDVIQSKSPEVEHDETDPCNTDDTTQEETQEENNS